MNKQHPFGLPLWKPALYKKSRSVVRKANSSLHSSPSSSSELFLNPGNILWSVLFGWWLALVVFCVSLPLSLFKNYAYGMVLRELSFYLLWPFGRYVERLVEITPEVMSDLERERLTREASILIEDEDENEHVETEESHRRHQQHRRKRYNPLRAMIETFKLGPVGWLYYFLFYTIIGKLCCLNSKKTGGYSPLKNCMD